MSSQEIKNYLSSKFPNLSASTIKLYSIKLNQIFKNFNTEFDESLFLDFPNIINYIKNLDVSTDNKLAFLNAIIIIVRNAEDNDVFYTLQKYIDARNKLNSEKFDKYKDNIKSDNFEEYDKLLTLTLPPDFKNDSVADVLAKMNLYIAVRYPLRLSLYNAEIIKNKKNIDDEKNYLYITPRKIYFIMNNFKNVKIIGGQQIEVNEEHEKVIRDYVKWLNKNKLSEYLLWNFNLKNNKPSKYLGPDLYAFNLKRLFNSLDLNISMNDIRRSYESKLIKSDYYKNLSNREKEKEHLKLLHSPTIANLVYNKV